MHDPSRVRVSGPLEVFASGFAAELARLAATEEETRRLHEMVRTLSSDREGLLARVAVLEIGLPSSACPWRSWSSWLRLGGADRRRDRTGDDRRSDERMWFRES